MICFAGNKLNVISSVNLAAACYLPKETGPCRGYFVRYFYNISTGRCQRFAYGGCQGNRNNFKSLGECNNYCLVSENHVSFFFRFQLEIPENEAEAGLVLYNVQVLHRHFPLLLSVCLCSYINEFRKHKLSLMKCFGG